MKLRELREEDAPLMLEWMHDKSVTEHMATDFSQKTMDDCLNFIRSAQKDESNVHFAIEDEGTYMGTVSLKHIDREKKEAEFAITVRTAAMGKGISRFGMEHILEYAFSVLQLERVYWYVDRINARAVRFYDKNGYERVPATEFAHLGEIASNENYLWYVVKK